MLKMRIAVVMSLLTVSTATPAFWGFWPGSGWNDGYQRGYGGIGTEQYRGGSGDGSADFSMDFSAWMNLDADGHGSGYGRGDTWGRGYQGYMQPGHGVTSPMWAPHPGAYPPPGYGGMPPWGAIPYAR